MERSEDQDDSGKADRNSLSGDEFNKNTNSISGHIPQNPKKLNQGQKVSKGRPAKSRSQNDQEKPLQNLFTKNDQTFYSSSLIYIADIFKDTVKKNLKTISGFWIYTQLFKDHFKNIEEVNQSYKEFKQFYQKINQAFKSFLKSCLSCGPKQVMLELLKILKFIYQRIQQKKIQDLSPQIKKYIAQQTKKFLLKFQNSYIAFKFKDQKINSQFNLSPKKVQQIQNNYLKWYINTLVDIIHAIYISKSNNLSICNKSYDQVFKKGKQFDSDKKTKQSKKGGVPNQQDNGPTKKRKKQ